MSVPEEGGKGLIEKEALYKHTKIKTAHNLDTSDDEHSKLVKYFQKRKEDKSLKWFKDFKRYMEELSNLTANLKMEPDLSHMTNQVVTVNGKEPQNIKEILRKAPKQKKRTAVMKQPCVWK